MFDPAKFDPKIYDVPLMLDAPFLLKTLLETFWNENLDDPSVASIKWSFRGTGFDENACYPQIVLEETPQLPCKIENVTEDIIKVTHPVLLTVHVRPVKYTEDVIDATRATFRNMMLAVTEVLRREKDEVDNVITVLPSDWKIDIDMTVEPVVFKASMAVTLVYYRSGLEWSA